MANIVKSATKNTVSSWKTTIAGIVAGITLAGPEIQLLLDGDAMTQPDWGVIGVALAIAFGLSQARDGDVSSEKAGAS